MSAQCYHRWLITAHLVPIVGHFLTQLDKIHPLTHSRFAHYGYESWDGHAHQTKVLHPLAGCRATCRDCGEKFDDTEPEATSMPSLVKTLSQPIVLIAH